MEATSSTASPEQVRSNRPQSLTEVAADENNGGVNLIHSSESDEGDLDVDTAESCAPVNQTIRPCQSDSSYTVTCTVSIALAIPRVVEDAPVATVETGQKPPKKVLPNGTVEAHKPPSYYHIEYNLLPDSKEPIKVDLVMFGLAAKIYTENETKVLKPWQEGDHVWLAWSQSVKISVTRQLLVKMPTHKITFRVWDTKDRVSAKARYDRPKTFRLPLGRGAEEPDQSGAVLDCEAERSGGIRSLVYKLRAAYKTQNPKNRTVKFQTEKPSVEDESCLQINCSTDRNTSQTAAHSPVARNSGGITTRETMQLSKQRYVHYGGMDNPGRTDVKSTKSEAVSEQVMNSSMKDNGLKVSMEKPAQKSAQENTAEMEHVRRNGIVSAQLDAMNLLAGDRSLTDCFVTCFGQVSDGLCSVVLDQPLMSEELAAELNPLVVTILSASCLPSTPVPYHVLQQKCLPVYCQYSFPNMPIHRTKGQPHGSNIYFRDVNVIFTGLMSAGELLRTFRSTVLNIEVHDRDRKAEKPCTGPALFGTEPNDDKLASVVLVTTNPFREKKKLPEPYGIAKLNLSGLFQGHKCLNLSLPIKCSRPGSRLGGEKNEWEINATESAVGLDSPRGDFMPMGHYIDADSKVKVQVEIARSLDPDLVKSGGYCPFGRIVYILKYNNVLVLTKLRSEILRVNAAAFRLDSRTEEMAQRDLIGDRMNSRESANQNLNILTGFHMVDKTLHLFVLEGLKEQAIKKLWETVPRTLNKDAEKQVTVLYNSNLSFSERLYDTLDEGLTPIHLHKPLATILREPLVYVAGMVSYASLLAILRYWHRPPINLHWTKINHLCQVKKLEEAVENNLFPSANMVVSLGIEFGTAPRRRLERLIVEAKDAEEQSCPPVSQRRAYTPLDNANEEYLAWKRRQANQGLCTKNFIQGNIDEVRKARSAAQRSRSKMIVVEPDGTRSAHNYSVQTRNCTVRALELLREEMAKEPALRFSYNQHYHSFTVAPVDIETERKASASRSRSAWHTHDGFVYPGFKSGIESNRHPKQPDEARVEELRKPWRENVLHGNMLRPTLNRSTWPWNQRHEDFERYSKPPTAFSPVPPVTIHLAGEALQQGQLQAAHAQYGRWLRKVLPDKNCPGGSRVPEFKCHMRRAGLDKPHDLMKDKPMNPLSKESMERIKAQNNGPANAQRGRREGTGPDQSKTTVLRFLHTPNHGRSANTVSATSGKEKRLHVFQEHPQTHGTPAHTSADNISAK